MLKKINLALLVTIILVTSNYLNAQEQKNIPKPLSDLMQFVGQWEGQTTMILEGKKYQFTYYADFKKTADGNGVSMDEWFNSPELGSLKGSNLIGYNANDGKIHWFSVDNFGTAHEHLGNWKSSQHFFMQANEIQQKKKFVEKIDIIIKNNDTLIFTLVATLDGKEFENVSVTFNRKK